MTRLPKTATETCLNCQTTHVLPVETDEDGAYVDLDTEVCNDDHCTRKLCSACPQFTCEICTLTFCEEHMVLVGTEKVCGLCAKVISGEVAPK